MTVWLIAALLSGGYLVGLMTGMLIAKRKWQKGEWY